MTDSAKQVTFHTAGGQLEHLRNFFYGPFFYIPQGKHFLLANGESTEEVPNMFTFFAAYGFLFRGWVATGDMRFLEIHRLLPPPLPPTRASPVATGVERNPCKPGLPGEGSIVCFARLQQLQKDLLRNLFGFVQVIQPEAAELYDPRMVHTVQLFVEVLLVGHALVVSHVFPTQFV